MGFFRYELRTTDVTGARDFYIDVFGPEFWSAGVGIVPLPEAAAARGAPAHWLGYIDASHLDATADRFERLGAPAVRDPFGAVLALGSGTGVSGLPVALQVHHSRAREQAVAFYSELFGAEERPLFVTAGSPEIHSQWLFFFRVADIDRSMEQIRRLGGLVLEPTKTPDGDVLVACDDPQGAAFGLRGSG